MRYFMLCCMLASLLGLACQDGGQAPAGAEVDIDEALYMASDEADRLRRYFQALKAERVHLYPFYPMGDADDETEALGLQVVNSDKLRDSLSVSPGTAALLLQEAVSRALMFPEDYAYLMVTFTDDTRPAADTSLQLDLTPGLLDDFEWED